MRTTEAIQMFIADCKYRNLSPKTIESYTWALHKLARVQPRLPAEPGPIKSLIAGQELAPESKHDLWRNLRAFYHWLAAQEIAADAMAGIPPPRTRRRLPRTLEPFEIAALFQRVQLRRDRAMIALALDTGIRLGELAGLTWPAVTSSGLRVDGKTGERTVPVSGQVRQLMLGLGDGYSIWTGRRGPLTRSGVQQITRRAMYRAGILPPKAGSHVLRHTFGKMYIMNGGDAFSLQRIMGHSKLETTMIYVYMNDKDIARQHAKFSPVARLDLLTGQLEDFKEEAAT